MQEIQVFRLNLFFFSSKSSKPRKKGIGFFSKNNSRTKVCKRGRTMRKLKVQHEEESLSDVVERFLHTAEAEVDENKL